MIMEKIIKEIEPGIKGNNVLEIACGEAAFSLKASNCSRSVVAIDIEDVRLKRVKDIPANLKLVQHDALNLSTLDYDPDVIVCVNGISHMKDIAIQVINEALKKASTLFIISTWKLDKYFMIEEIEPQLTSLNYSAKHHKQFSIYKIRK